MLSLIRKVNLLGRDEGVKFLFPRKVNLKASRKGQLLISLKLSKARSRLHSLHRAAEMR